MLQRVLRAGPDPIKVSAPCRIVLVANRSRSYTAEDCIGFLKDSIPPDAVQSSSHFADAYCTLFGPYALVQLEFYRTCSA
jgi:hypothetical protein